MIFKKNLKLSWVLLSLFFYNASISLVQSGYQHDEDVMMASIPIRGGFDLYLDVADQMAADLNTIKEVLTTLVGNIAKQNKILFKKGDFTTAQTFISYSTGIGALIQSIDQRAPLLKRRITEEDQKMLSLTLIACGPLTKNCEAIENFVNQTGLLPESDLQTLLKARYNVLNISKKCFKNLYPHDAYGK